jgi:hypothetical protein|tara:strand:+ start:1404 stop:2018 length:615 start_codon:yes stop_codon:yes gene_type:complete
MKDNYFIIREAVSKELCGFIYEYFKLKRKGFELMSGAKLISPFVDYWGSFGDSQVTDTYCCYGDPAMDSLLSKLKPLIEKTTDLKLSETYTYARLYKNGDILERHKDRFSCEISATVHLGGTRWPIYVDKTGGTDEEGTRIDLNVGDILCYKGEKIEHWRYALHGEECAQVFLHYNDAAHKDAKQNKFDGREFLGIPKCLQRKK